MPARSVRSRRTVNPALVWLGLVTIAIASMSVASSLAHGHELPHAPIVDGHAIQPRADEFEPPYGEPDVSSQDAHTIDELYNELLRGSENTCLPAVEHRDAQDCSST
jgi:hypothetical protein